MSVWKKASLAALALCIVAALVFAGFRSSVSKKAAKRALGLDAIEKQDQEEDDAIREALRGSGMPSEKAAGLEKAFAKNPDDLSAANALLGYYFLKARGDKEMSEKRIALIASLIKHHPKATILEGGYGQLGPGSGGEEVAKRLWAEQIAKNPGAPDMLYNAGCSMISIAPALAEKYLLEGKKLEPNSSRFSFWLGALYMLGSRDGSLPRDPKKALAEYENVYTLGDNSDNILANMAEAAFEAGDFKKAEDYAKEMLGVMKGRKLANKPGEKNWDDGNLVFYGNLYLGRLAFKRGQLDEAERFLLAAGKTPGSPQLDSGSVDCSLAAELLSAGRKDAVLKFLDEVSVFYMDKEGCASVAAFIKSGGNPFRLEKDEKTDSLWMASMKLKLKK